MWHGANLQSIMHPSLRLCFPGQYMYITMYPSWYHSFGKHDDIVFLASCWNRCSLMKMCSIGQFRVSPRILYHLVTQKAIELNKYIVICVLIHCEFIGDMPFGQFPVTSWLMIKIPLYARYLNYIYSFVVCFVSVHDPKSICPNKLSYWCYVHLRLFVFVPYHQCLPSHAYNVLFEMPSCSGKLSRPVVLMAVVP